MGFDMDFREDPDMHFAQDLPKGFVKGFAMDFAMDFVKESLMDSL